MNSYVVPKPTENLIKLYNGSITPPKFMPSYYEYLRLMGEQIVAAGGVGGAGTLQAIYDVPTGYTLYITTAEIAFNTDTATRYGSINTAQMEIMKVTASIAAAGQKAVANMSKTFTIPIKVESGDHVYVKKGAGVNEELYGNITGFIIINSLIPFL